ncbi:type III secretion system stalk subunit SctO [Rugamonas aquatica]|nr:YscO family type III secretion system apparatus protein [Rugamonas aquatica]
MLEQILRVKRHREEKAEMAVASGRSVLAEAARRSELAGVALTQYQQWSAQRERSMYADLCQRVVAPRELQWLREDVASLRETEREKQELLAKAELQREQAEDDLREARNRLALAVRTRQKFIELVAAEDDLLRHESERGDEIETDDNHVAGRERDNWREHDEP